MKRLIVIRDKKTKILPHKEFIHIAKRGKSEVVSYRYIKAIFINLSSNISISVCYKVAQSVPLFFIDKNGYIVAKFECEVSDEEI